MTTSQTTTTSSPRRPWYWPYKDPAAWGRQYVATLASRTSHAITMKRIAEIGTLQQKVRRLDEQRLITLRRMTWDLRMRNRARQPLTMEDYRALHRFRAALQGFQIGTIAELAKYKTHVETLAKRLSVEVRHVVTAGADNAYAWATLRRIEIEPLRSSWEYFSALHEFGHCANPCRPDHKRVPMKTGKSCCCRCELNAWKWAQQHALVWNRDAHENMIRALETYRAYATADEPAEIDQITSDIGFRRALAARWLREVGRAS